MPSFDYESAGITAPPTAHVPVPNAFSPRRFGVLPLAALSSPYQAERNSSFDPSQPKLVASRLTQKELNEPLGHSPIRGAGAARFGIMPEKSNNEPLITAGKATPRGETVASLLSQSRNILGNASARRNNNNNSNNHTHHNHAEDNSSPTSARSSGAVVISGREGSPRDLARANARQTTFSAIPGGPENINSFRFGQVVLSDQTAKSIITPRFQETHVTASPDKIRSRRKFGAKYGDDEGDKEVRLEPSALPAACLPTKEGVQNKAAFSAIKAKDTLKDIMASAGEHQRDLLGSSSGKVTARDAPPSTLPTPRRVEDPNDNHAKFRHATSPLSPTKLPAILRPEVLAEKQQQQQQMSPDEPITFGMPTARKGVEPPVLRKLTDARNYGDEPSSGDLVLGADRAMIARLLTEKSLNSSDDAVAWANKCDFGLSEEEARYAYVAATAESSEDGKSISLQEFKAMVDLLFP